MQVLVISVVSLQAHAIRLAAIDLAFLLLLAVAFVYIEFGGVEVDEATYAIMQLTVIVIVGTLGLIGGYFYYLKR